MGLEARLSGVLGKIANQEEVLNINAFRDINRVPERQFVKEVYRFPEEGSFEEAITIIPLSDIHLGNKQCNLDKLQRAIDLILRTKNCYTILMGDQMETATRTSIGMGVYDEDFPIEQQIAKISKMLRPLADAGKIIGVLTGNHEMRVTYTTSINIVKLIAEELGINYFGFQGYVNIHVGNQSYNVFSHHGAGGGSTAAGKLNAMRKLNQVALADIYLSGHTHGRLYDYDLLMTIDEETQQVKPMKRHYITCGSFLEYWNGYAEMKLLTPSLTGVVAITLDPTEKDVRVML